MKKFEYLSVIYAYGGIENDDGETQKGFYARVVDQDGVVHSYKLDPDKESDTPGTCRSAVSHFNNNLGYMGWEAYAVVMGVNAEDQAVFFKREIHECTGFRKLGSEIPGDITVLGVTLTDDERKQVPIEYLMPMYLPKTSELIAQSLALDSVARTGDYAPKLGMPNPKYGTSPRNWARQRLAKIEVLLAEADQRDRLEAIQKARGPEFSECWCLGWGGEGEAFNGLSETATFARFCGCPDGKGAYAAYRERQHMDLRWKATTMIQRRWSAMRIPTAFDSFTFDTFPWDASNATVLGKIRGVLETPGRWMYLHGFTGRGKTGLMVAAMKELAAQHSCLFIEWAELLDGLRRSYSHHDGEEGEPFSNLMDAVCMVGVLGLDDLGAEYHGKDSDYGRKMITRVVDFRSKHDKRTLVTSNLNLIELEAEIGARATWRIFQRAEVIQLDGPNLRAQ